MKKQNIKNNKKIISNIMVYSATTIAATTIGISMCKWGNIPIPIFNDKVSVYNNDTITYSSLDHTISTLEGEESKELKDLNSENLKLYSNWIESGDNWSRMITTFELSTEDIKKMKELVTLNATEEDWQTVIDSLTVRKSISQTSIGEPTFKEDYFEFTYVDDTVYQIPATISMEEGLTGLLGIGGFNFAFDLIGKEILAKKYKKESSSEEVQKVKSIDK